MSDDGGRAPEPSDLGSDWVEALLGEPPKRTGTTTPAEAAPPAEPTAEPLELGSMAMAEALLGDAPQRTPPVPSPTPPPTPPPAPTWVEPEVAAPRWAGEQDDEAAWAPEAADEEGWTPPPPAATAAAAVFVHPPVVPEPVVPEPVVEQAPAAEPGVPDVDLSSSSGLQAFPVSDGWDLAPRPPDVDASSSPGVQAFPVSDGWDLPPLVPGRASEPTPERPVAARSGLPYLGIEPQAPGASTPDPPSPVDAFAPTTAATSALLAEPSLAAPPAMPDAPGPTDQLVDPSAPAPTLHPPPTVVPPSGFLDLRPGSAPAGAPPVAAAGKVRGRGKAKVRTAGETRRLRVLVGVGIVVVLVVGLVVAQLVSEDDGEPDAVLTADAATLEADEAQDDERGVTLGVGEDEADPSDAGADDEATGDEEEGTAATTATTAAGSGSTPTTATGGGGGSASPAQLAVSASSLAFGSSTGRSISIRNEGGTTMSWSAGARGAGFSIAGASSGTLRPGQAHDIQVSFNASGVGEGTASGALDLNGAGSRSVSLSATVSRPPVITGVSWASCGPTSRLRMTVTDESGVASVAVAGTSPAGPGFRKSAVSQGSGSYRADVGPFSSNGQITYFVEATDSRGNVARTGVQYRSWNNGC
jgi:hypothetical protein